MVMRKKNLRGNARVRVLNTNTLTTMSPKRRSIAATRSMVDVFFLVLSLIMPISIQPVTSIKSLVHRRHRTLFTRGRRWRE